MAIYMQLYIASYKALGLLLVTSRRDTRIAGAIYPKQI